MINQTHILSTRILPQSLIDEAKKADIHIDTISFIHTEPITSNGLKKLLVSLYTKEIVAVFTSMNAVEAVKNVANINKPNWKIFCIGDATASLVREHFGEGSIVGTADNAAALADVIIHAGIKEAIFFCGVQHRPELPDKLIKNNIDLKEILVYRTIETPQFVSNNYNGILFFSPSAVESFFLVNKVDKDTIFFAIGNTTADTIQRFSNNKIITSERPGKISLAQQAIAYFKSIDALH